MGNEASCTIQFGKQRSEGKALLETSEVLFRGDFRLKIPFSAVKSAKAVDGELRLQTAEGLAVFHLGAAAENGETRFFIPSRALKSLELSRNRECLSWASSTRTFFANSPGSQSPLAKAKL